MTITFENENDIIVYALEKIISYARNNQHIFLAQSVWWISSILRLQEELIIHIDKLTVRNNIGRIEIPPESAIQSEIPISGETSVHPERVSRIQYTDRDYITSESESISTTETDTHNQVIDNCKISLKRSKQERKTIRKSTQQSNRVKKADRKGNRKNKKPIKTL
jgi:hypothetical protein